MISIKKYGLCAVAALTVGALSISAPASAQDGYTGQAAPPPAAAQQQAAPTYDVSTQELSAFVEAKNEVDEISAEYSDRFQNLQDPAQGEQLQQEMNERMVEAVQSSGLTIDQYNQIAMAVQYDPDVQAQFLQMAN